MPKAVWNGAVIAESEPEAAQIEGTIAFWKGVKVAS